MHGGDILLTPEQQATFESMSNPNDPFAPQSAVVVNQRSLWIDGVVPYIFDSSLSCKLYSSVVGHVNLLVKGSQMLLIYFLLSRKDSLSINWSMSFLNCTPAIINFLFLIQMFLKFNVGGRGREQT